MDELDDWFNIHVAVRVGAQAAILLKHLNDMIEEGKGDVRNLRDGSWWTKATVEELQRQCPYLTCGKIRDAVKKLKDAGYIITAEFDATNWDQTKYYAITLKGSSALIAHGPIYD